MSESPKTGLLEAMDDAARELLKSVNATTMEGAETGEVPQPIDLKGRVAAFQAVTSYLAVKHKIQPEEDGASGIDGYRSAINSGTARRRTRSLPPQGGSHRPEPIESDERTDAAE